jgi:uncharacterized membrane protein
MKPALHPGSLWLLLTFAAIFTGLLSLVGYILVHRTLARLQRYGAETRELFARLH